MGAQAPDPPPVVNVYKTGGAATNCVALGSNGTRVATLQVGQCYTYTEAASAYPGTGDDVFKLCSSDQEQSGGPAAEPLKLAYGMRGYAQSQNSRVQLYAYDRVSYDSGSWNPLVDQTFSEPGAWYTATTETVPGFHLYTYIGGSNQVGASVALNVCLLALRAEPEPTPTPTPGHTPRIVAPEVHVQPYVIDDFLTDNWALLTIPPRLLEGIGAANFRDYFAFIAAVVALARFLRRPPIPTPGAQEQTIVVQGKVVRRE